MIRPDAVNWSVAILFSLFVHSVFLMGSSASIGAVSATAVQVPIITRLSFNAPIDDVVPDEPQQLEKVPPKSVEKVKAQLDRQEPDEIALVVEEPVAQKAPSVEESEPVRQVAVQKMAQQPVHGQPVSLSTESMLHEERQQYLHELMAHIESHKYYPRAARKRGVQGKVKVSFTLLDDGYCGNLELDGRHSVLVKAARNALETAQPLPEPPEGVAFSERVEFTMVYSLTN